MVDFNDRRHPGHWRNQDWISEESKQGLLKDEYEEEQAMKEDNQ